MPYQIFTINFIWGALTAGISFWVFASILKWIDKTLLSAFILTTIIVLIVWILLGFV